MRIALQIVKLWWMILWRLSVLESLIMSQPSSIPVLVAIVGALLIGLVAKKTVTIFPLIRLMMRKPVIIPIGSKAPHSPNNGVPQRYVPSTAPAAHAANVHVSPGGSMQYAPRTLETVPDPAIPQMFGVPGKSLATATSLSASNVQAGALGEKNFAKTLAVEGLLPQCVSLWSVRMPGTNGFMPDPQFSSDIDCILFYGQTVLLLDMKLYTGGDITYHANGNHLYRVDNKTQMTVGKPITMSKNMNIAHERFSNLYPHLSVYPMIVFIPTDKGSATLQGVEWPGGIPAVNLVDMVQYLKTVLPQAGPPSPQDTRAALPLIA